MIKIVECQTPGCANENQEHPVHLPMAGPSGMFFDTPLVCRCGNPPKTVRYKAD